MGPVIARAEERLREWLEASVPDMAARYDRAALQSLRARVLEADPAIAHDMSRVRLRVLEGALRETGYPPREARRLAGEAFRIFLDARHAVEYYEDVPGVLAALRGRYVLGALTNGNADVGRLEIGPLFDFALTAADVGASKPDPRMFEAALARAGVEAARGAHVGDHPEHDIAGAARVGMHTVWVNRSGEPPPRLPHPPTREIRTLAELPEVLARL